jgi:inorganic triphosphatase YgiF
MSRHPAEQPLELEIKFHLPPGAQEAVSGHPALQTANVRRLHQITTYFDTLEGDLFREGVTLRVRRCGKRLVQTLKLEGERNGPFGRNEWEWPVRTEVPDLDRVAETPIADLLREAPALRPMFVTDVKRTIGTVRFDNALIEVALDGGRIDAGDATEPISELELELKDGDPGPIYRFAAALHAVAPMVLGTESKADRGWRLRTGRPRDAVKQLDIDLAGDVTAAEGFRRIIDGVLAHLMANQPAAAAGDIEGVHQMRVAIRRLRAALVLFRPRLEPHVEARFTAALRSLGHIFGEARDWDVFCREILASAEEHGVARSWLDLLRGPAEEERAAAHARVADELRAPTLTAVVLGLAEWGAPDNEAMHIPLVQRAPKLVERLERRVVRRGHNFARRSDEELHALRKALKKLRYSVEFLSPVHRDKQAKAYLRVIKKLLKHLGSLNDAVVVVALAARLGGERQPELAPAVAALAAWAARRRDKAHRHIQRDWRHFKSATRP